MTSSVYGSLETWPRPLTGLGETIMNKIDIVPDFMELLAGQCIQGSPPI